MLQLQLPLPPQRPGLPDAGAVDVGVGEGDASQPTQIPPLARHGLNPRTPRHHSLAQQGLPNWMPSTWSKLWDSGSTPFKRSQAAFGGPTGSHSAKGSQ